MASDRSRRCAERTSLSIGKLQSPCYDTGGTAEMSEDIQDITHEIARGRRWDHAFPVLAKRP